jgi:hypothetical protein
VKGHELFEQMRRHLDECGDRRSIVTFVVEMPGRKLGLTHVTNREAFEELFDNDEKNLTG